LKPYDNYEIKTTIGLPWQEILHWTQKEKKDVISHPQALLKFKA